MFHVLSKIDRHWLCAVYVHRQSMVEPYPSCGPLIFDGFRFMCNLHNYLILLMNHANWFRICAYIKLLAVGLFPAKMKEIIYKTKKMFDRNIYSAGPVFQFLVSHLRMACRKYEQRHRRHHQLCLFEQTERWVLIFGPFCGRLPQNRSFIHIATTPSTSTSSPSPDRTHPHHGVSIRLELIVFSRRFSNAD